MDLSLNEHQRMLEQSVRSFMERRAPRSKIVALQRSERGYEPETWKTIAELGWLGLLIPEQYGGGGASLTDAAVLYQEFGRGPLPGPFFSSGVLCALVLLEVGHPGTVPSLLACDRVRRADLLRRHHGTSPIMGGHRVSH